MTPPKIDGLRENIVVEGNRIENSQQDGIKVSQCNRVRIENNIIDGFDRMNAKEIEQGIDFVAVGNSQISGNRVLSGGTGMTAKGGAINLSIHSNDFVGPYRWTGLTIGEPSLKTYSFYSSYSGASQYQAKQIMVSNNRFGDFANSSSVAMIACQECSLSKNQMIRNKVQVISRADSGVTSHVCVEADHALEISLTSQSEILRTGCDSFGDRWIKGQVVDRGGSIGFDIH